MQLFALFSMLFVALAVADIAVLQKAISVVNDALTALDTTLLTFKSGDAALTKKLIDQTEAVQTALTTGTSQINGTTPISLIDALSLQQSANALLANVKTTMADMATKAAEIEKATDGTSAILIKSLKAQKVGAQDLADVLITKVPTVVKTLAKNAIGQVVAAIEKGAAAFTGKLMRLRFEGGFSGFDGAFTGEEEVEVTRTEMRS